MWLFRLGHMATRLLVALRQAATARLPRRDRSKWLSSGHQLPANQRQWANSACSTFSSGRWVALNDPIGLILSISPFTYLPEAETFWRCAILRLISGEHRNIWNQCLVSVIMIVISNLVMSIVEREPGGFRNHHKTAHQYSVLALLWLVNYDIYKKLLVS